jgi:hypothetical protein
MNLAGLFLLHVTGLTRKINSPPAQPSQPASSIAIYIYASATSPIALVIREIEKVLAHCMDDHPIDDNYPSSYSHACDDAGRRRKFASPSASPVASHSRTAASPHVTRMDKGIIRRAGVGGGARSGGRYFTCFGGTGKGVNKTKPEETEEGNQRSQRSEAGASANARRSSHWVTLSVQTV